MECCSPDVGDCQKCHPELWIQKGSSYCSWIPKTQKKTRSNRKGNRLSRQIPRKTRRRTA